MAPNRKRRPGGGRKPAGTIHGKTEAFSTRITAETRKALLLEKRLSGRSVSQIAEQLLILGLEAKRERERDHPMRALAFLIDQLSINISGTPGGKQGFRWRTDPFLFRALHMAVFELMTRLAPEGDPLKMPPDLVSVSTPGDLAVRAVNVVWHLFGEATSDFTERPELAEWSAAIPERIRAAVDTLAKEFAKAKSSLRGNRQGTG
jgi:hypothetical protein